MKKQTFLYYCKIVALLLATLLLKVELTDAQSTAVQSGKITGKVVDAETGKVVIGANVSITGTNRGAATDLDGKYTIRDLPPGIYSVTVSYISYAKKTVTGIEVESGEPTGLNIKIQPETIGMEEVTVTATASSNNEAGLLSIQRKAVPVQDGLSAEFLDKTGDGDAASAMKRVTGVTLMNDNQVYVRGLGNRYSNVQLNGSDVPSTNPTEKEAPIDLVGSGLVNNIVVQKTYTPDQSGEFSGGSVKITTREFPEKKNVSFSYSTSVNSVSTFNSTLGSGGSATDFLGYDNGKRRLPGILKSQRLTLGKLEGRVANALHRDWNLKNSNYAVPSQKFSINYANQFNEERLPIGVVSSFTYKYDRDFKPNTRLFKIQSSAGNGTVIPNSDYTIDKGIENVKLGGMVNFFIKPSEVTKIGVKNLYSNSLENSASVIAGDYINYDKFKVRQTVLNFDRRSIFSSALEFETYFRDFINSRLTANLNYNNANRNQPDRRATQYNRDTTVPDSEYGIYFNDGGNNHYFAKQNDNNYSAELDYEFVPYSFLTIKSGGSYLLKNRYFSARRFEYDAYNFRSVEFEAYPNDLRISSPENALNPQLVEQNKLQLTENTQPRDSYEGNQLTWAGYLSTKWTPIRNTIIEVGVRLENSDQEVSFVNAKGAREQMANVGNLDLLPAANLTYSIDDKTNIRAAFSKTLARPDFREISEFRFQNFLGGEILYGNPDLKRTSIQNLDLRFETYPNPGELFAVSVYYKYFDNPIEKVYRVTERLEVKYENAKKGELYGLEVEGRKNLTDHLQLVANGSFIFSETRVRDEWAANVANISRPMYGQSPFTVNIGAFYTIPEWNLNVSTNYNTFGRRIVTVGINRHPGDEYEQPFHYVSFKADYKIRNMSLSFSMENILNDDKVYKQGEITTFKYSPGMTFDFGIKLSL